MRVINWIFVTGCVALASAGWSQTPSSSRQSSKSTPAAAISIGLSDFGGRSSSSSSRDTEDSGPMAPNGAQSGPTSGPLTMRDSMQRMMPPGGKPGQGPGTGRSSTGARSNSGGEGQTLSGKFWRAQSTPTNVPMAEPTPVSENTPRPLLGGEEFKQQTEQQNRIETQRINLK